MKKTICTCLTIFIIFLAGCGQQPVGKNEANSQLAQLGKASPDLIEEVEKKISLPEKGFANLVSMDKDYYYFENNDDKQWKYLRVNRNQLDQMRILKPIDKSRDIKLQYGYQGNLYVGVMDWSSVKDDTFTGDYDPLESPGRYRLLRLKSDQTAEQVFSCNTMGFPSVVPSGGKVAIEVNNGRHIDLKLLDLQTEKTSTIFQSDYERAENGNFTGTILMGMDYPNPAPSSQGICYQACKLQNEPFHTAKTGKNQFYFYDFQTAKTQELGAHYRPVEYAGGTDRAYLTSDYPADESENFVKLYMPDSKGQNFQPYDFKAEDLESGIKGSGFIGDDLLLAYHEGGFYVINLKDKSYFQKTYSMIADELEPQDLKKLDYQRQVTGFAYEGNTFALAESSGSAVIIHEITSSH